MKQSWEKIGNTIGLIIANVFVIAAITMAAYNIIAWEFNLPTFNYWAFVLFRVAYLLWFGKVRFTHSKGEK